MHSINPARGSTLISAVVEVDDVPETVRRLHARREIAVEHPFIHPRHRTAATSKVSCRPDVGNAVIPRQLYDESPDRKNGVYMSVGIQVRRADAGRNHSLDLRGELRFNGMGKLRAKRFETTLYAKLSIAVGTAQHFGRKGGAFVEAEVNADFVRQSARARQCASQLKVACIRHDRCRRNRSIREAVGDRGSACCVAAKIIGSDDQPRSTRGMLRHHQPMLPLCIIAGDLSGGLDARTIQRSAARWRSSPALS